MGDVAAALTWPLSRPLPRAGTMPAFRGVRRCLFGPVDHDSCKAYQEDQYKKLQSDDKKRWDFDFLNSTPLPGGRYCWAPVQNVPEKDNNGESEEKQEKPAQMVEQTQITKFFRKRKAAFSSPAPKTKRRSST